MIIQDIITQASPDSPKWTDIVSAVSAAIGIPLVIVTLFKLIKRDKERESEIESLSTIANKIADIQKENVIRYKASKKPYFEYNLNRGEEGFRLKIDFTNLNLTTTLVHYDITNTIDFGDINLIKTTINNVGGRESFSIFLNGKDRWIENINLHMEYKTEEDYSFIQNITIWLDNDQYMIAPSAIINKENSK